MKERLRNFGLWVSVAAFVLLLAQTFGLKVATEQYNEIVKGGLGILVLLGILSDPTTGKWYSDK